MSGHRPIRLRIITMNKLMNLGAVALFLPLDCFPGNITSYARPTPRPRLATLAH